ncbi:DUF84 family protein [Bacillus sp. HMF5848]|uniref:DUF84 family protein n=1 Tax=Bacillus sp. HMF5848 TaxID=2495421 RepID=UPI000F773066|nr:DUF84 family protein [Bacillus sp. HMF5848]RSK28215.1 DUF84 family protein [Bacillus sp. HMF5848]
MKIAIGSLNPAKVNAIKGVWKSDDIQFVPTDVPSGVAAQPLNDTETIEGAINRAINSKKKVGASIGIGLEGGVCETPYGLFLINWGALVYQDEEPIVAGGARIQLPAEVAMEVRKGTELGIVMDAYTKKDLVRHHEGAVGIFTNGLINRSEMFTHVTKLLVGQYEYKQLNMNQK